MGRSIMLSSFIWALTSLGATTSVYAVELIMFEQPGCVWCARFDREIAPAYAKTNEGQRVPLRRINIREPLPDDIAHIPPDRYTPTFVLVDDGVEIDRIRGYPGNEFFWPLLDAMLGKLDQR